MIPIICFLYLCLPLIFALLFYFKMFFLSLASLNVSFIESESHSGESDSVTPWTVYSPWNSPGQSTGLLEGIFPTQGLNPSLPPRRQILYQLSHQGSPRILEWLAYPFSSGPSQPRNWTKVSCFAGGFFTSWAIISEMKYHLFLVFSLSFCPLFLSFPNSNLHGYFMSDIIFSVL